MLVWLYAPQTGRNAGEDVLDEMMESQECHQARTTGYLDDAIMECDVMFDEVLFPPGLNGLDELFGHFAQDRDLRIRYVGCSSPRSECLQRASNFYHLLDFWYSVDTAKDTKTPLSYQQSLVFKSAQSLAQGSGSCIQSPG